MENRKKLQTKKCICSEVSVNSLEIHVISPEEQKDGYSGKDLQTRKVLSMFNFIFTDKFALLQCYECIDAAGWAAGRASSL